MWWSILRDILYGMGSVLVFQVIVTVIVVYRERAPVRPLTVWAELIRPLPIVGRALLACALTIFVVALMEHWPIWPFPFDNSITITSAPINGLIYAAVFFGVGAASMALVFVVIPLRHSSIERWLRWLNRHHQIPLA